MFTVSGKENKFVIVQKSPANDPDFGPLPFPKHSIGLGPCVVFKLSRKRCFRAVYSDRMPVSRWFVGTVGTSTRTRVLQLVSRSVRVLWYVLVMWTACVVPLNQLSLMNIYDIDLHIFVS